MGSVQGRGEREGEGKGGGGNLSAQALFQGP